MMEYCSNRNDSLPPSCLDVSNSSVLAIFGAFVPNCITGSWSNITKLWLIGFYLYLTVFALLYLSLAVACVIFLSKRHLAQRFKAKTFIAIDIALAILGFSKVTFFIIDPFGISGYCTHYSCVVISRLLFAVGFPSLTAAYTLVFLTFWYSARMRLGRSCIQKWRIIIPLCFIHYLVAIIFEFIGAFGNSYYILFLLIACETFFTMWGLMVCCTFLIGGIRLLRSVNTSARQSSIVSRDIVIHDEIKKNGKIIYTRSHSTMKLKPRKQHKQAIRKVAIITYGAAGLGAIYSLLGVIQLVMVSLQLFGECDDSASQNSNLWLALKYISGMIEVLLAILLIYSINDVRPFVIFLKKYIVHCRRVSDEEKSKGDNIFRYTDSVKTSSRSSSPTCTTLQVMTKSLPPPPPSPPLPTNGNVDSAGQRPLKEDSTESDKSELTLSSNRLSRTRVTFHASPPNEIKRESIESDIP